MSPILEISTGVGCPPNCDFCPQKPHVHAYAQRSSEFKMSTKTFAACIDNVPKNVEIMFAGMAEPWLNPRCTDMVYYAHETGHPISVYTTCLGMDRDDALRLRYLPFIHFCIHLPDEAERMTLNVDDHYLNALQGCLRDIPNATLMCIGKVKQSVRDVIGRDVVDGSAALIGRAGNVPGITPVYKSERLKKLPCMEHSVLLPNGDVVLCCCDYALKHTLGNLLTQDYVSLFSGEEFKKIEAGLSDESIDIICRKCEIAECA